MLPEDRRLLVLQDVSELRRVEAARRDFVANVSHELRTPVAALKALVETLAEKPNRLIFSGKPAKLTSEAEILKSAKPLPAKKP